MQILVFMHANKIVCISSVDKSSVILKCLIFLIAADMKTGGGVYKGEPKQGKADCTLTIDDGAMMDMAAGKLDGQTVSTGSANLNLTVTL